MAAAARAAADPRVLRAVDAIRVVNLLSWRYRDPGLLLGELIGADDPATRYTGVGGNVPQTLVNQACLDIAAGRADVVLLAGAETWRTRKRQKANGIRPGVDASRTSRYRVAPGAEDGVEMAGPAEIAHRARPAVVRLPDVRGGGAHRRGGDARRAPPPHRRTVGAVQRGGPAQSARVEQRGAGPPSEIWQPGPDNRMISWPYTKLLNSNNMVDQARGTHPDLGRRRPTYLQIPSERWVFPWSGTDAHDTYVDRRARRVPPVTGDPDRGRPGRWNSPASASTRSTSSTSTRASRRRCRWPPPRSGCRPGTPARPLTVTGGLTFAGGPWNNYVMHSIATMAEQLVAQPGHARPDHRQRRLPHQAQLRRVQHRAATGTQFRWEDVQAEVDREPTRHGPGGLGRGGHARDVDRARSTGTANRRRRSWPCGPPTTRARWP